MTDQAYAGAVRSWAAHLIDGGDTPWAEWISVDRPVVDGDGVLPVLPGAPQLELVRLLAQRGLPDFARLAELVLLTPGTGRGLIDVPLPWPHRVRRFGTPPIDPRDLPADELIRVCVGVLAALLLPLPEKQHALAPGRRPPWRRRFTVQGAPGSVAAVRDALLAHGLVEGGRGGTHLVLVGPFEAMMAEQWAARVRAGSGMTWERMWEHAAGNDRIPPALDVAAIADRLGSTLGPESVRVIVAARSSDLLTAVVAALGVRPSTVEPVQPVLPFDDAAATDLVRRLQLVPGVVRRADLRGVLSELTAAPARGPLGAPTAQLAWAHRRAAGLTADLEEGHRLGRYAVHGDPGIVVPGADLRVRRTVDPTHTLEIALEACARAWRLTNGHLTTGQPTTAKED